MGQKHRQKMKNIDEFSIDPYSMHISKQFRCLCTNANI